MLNSKEDLHFSWFDMLKLLLFFMGKNKAQYIFWSTALLIIYFFELVPPLIIGKIIDYFTNYTQGSNLNEFYSYIGFLGLSLGLVAIIRLTIKRKLDILKNEATYQVKTQGFQRLLNYSLKWHDQENTGNKIQRITNGASSMRNFINILNNEIFRFINSFIAVIAIFLFLDWRILLLCISYLIIFFAIQIFFYRKAQKLINAGNIAQENASGKYYEGITNILSIKSLGATNSINTKITSSEETTKQLGNQLLFWGIRKWQIFQIFNAITIVLFLLTLGNVYITGLISLGSILVFWKYFENMQSNTGQITKYIDDLLEFKQNIARMAPIFEPSETAVNFGHKKFPKNWTTLQFKNANFKYNSAENTILDNINLTIYRNQKIGIAGQTGSGKSSLAKLILGLYTLNSGQLLIDKTNFYTIDPDEISKNIAVVLQESELFNFTLLENLTLLKNVPSELINKAIEIAQLQNLLAKLPDGLNTMIGEKGYRVSGGERQRIAIARAICMNTPILILDEATSNLDVNTEKTIQHAIETQLVDKTIISIAHRSSTLEKSDIIYVFKKGQIIEQGKYHELLNNPVSEFFFLNQL